MLRSFELILASKVKVRRFSLLFTHSANKGLQITCPALDAASQAMLQKHVTETEANRKALGLQGEAIILALVGKPELWTSGALKVA
ncbi:hypothetical protein LTR08_004827 [Meristemomyces frigidus]|nr:hypothetical protein LTR08_004827 [Meristemomyces frigidus]